MTGHVVTFYSYKGGVGRSMALANVAYLAAAWGKRVLCIDWDLEAPGLDRYLALSDAERAHPGLVDAVQSELAGRPTDWRVHVQTTRALGVPIDVLHAGRRDAHYLRSMQAIDWDAAYRDHNLGAVLDRWRDEAAAAYDLVLIDSRTGVTDTGSICAAQLPDTLVVITTPNEQSLEGTLQIVQSAQQVRNDIPWERPPLHVVPIVSRLEKHVEHQRTVAWWGRLEAALSPLTRTWCHAAVEPAKVLELLRIPHIAYWSFGEEVAAHRAGWQDPDDVGYAAATLTALLLQRMVGTELLVRSRDAYVARVDPGPADRFPLDVFVLHGQREASLAERVVADLRAAGLAVSSSSEDLDDPAETPWLLRARHCVVVRASGGTARRVEEERRQFEEAIAGDPRRHLVTTEGEVGPVLVALGVSAPDPEVDAELWPTAPLDAVSEALDLVGAVWATRAGKKTTYFQQQATEVSSALAHAVAALGAALRDGPPAARRWGADRVAATVAAARATEPITVQARHALAELLRLLRPP